VARGIVEGTDLEATVSPAMPAWDAARIQAERTALRFAAGAKGGSPHDVAEALLEIALAAAGDGPVPEVLVPLLARAAARARLAGPAVADAVARRVWQAARVPELAPVLADLPIAATGAWPGDRPDPRRARARRTGGAIGVALELEAALDAERRGALGTALAAYGSVIAVDPERLEAWTGIRRVARAGGDILGEARALARLGALVRDPERAAVLLEEAAEAYLRADRFDDAITALAKAVELRPDDEAAYQRAHDLLRTDLLHPGRAALFDNLLSHRLAVATLSPAGRAALLYERGQHRLERLDESAAAFADFKHVLSIQPEHREALHRLAQAALEAHDDPGAVSCLERFVAVAADDPRVAQARLDLAAAYESVRDPARAIETLRRASAASPWDPTPFHRLADLHLRAGDWRSALEALRAAEPRITDDRVRAALFLRIGAVLRDVGRDAPGAAAAFRRAAEIDPLGDGARALVALHDAAGDAGGALQTVEREIGALRSALAADPLDLARLDRLDEFLGMARARGRGAAEAIPEAHAAVASVRTLLAPERRGPGAPAPFAARSARALFEQVVLPSAGGFLAEIWPNLVEVAEALFPAPGGRERRAGVSVRGDARFVWIEAIAAVLGIPEVEILVSREARNALVTALGEPGAGLLLAPDAEQAPGFRFEVGRALGLLAQQVTVLERAGADALAPLFACAASLAGAALPRGLSAPSDEVMRSVTRTVSRKHRKALALQASRFAFESFDLAAWHEGALRTADRFGLLVAGDVAASALALAGERPAGRTAGDSQPTAIAGAARVASSRAALELLRFALSDRYPLLRRLASGTGDPTPPAAAGPEEPPRA